MLFTARISNFVSDSTPANQQSVVPNLSISKKTKPTQKTLLECGYNPKFFLDENKLPADFTPQVILDDDFNQLVDATGHPDGAVISIAKQVTTPPTAATPAVNSPIENVLPGTSTSLPVKDSRPSKVEKASSCTVTKSQSFGATGSPFTRFILKRTPEKGGSSAQEAVGKALSSTNASPDAAIIDSGNTRETRLEKLLSEAVEEATEKVKRNYFHSLLLSSQIQMTLSPKSTEHTSSETPSSNKSTADDQADFHPSESDTDTTSDSDLSSGDDVPLSRERPFKRQLKGDEGSPPRKRAKPRYVLTGWMYHKYPILKFFVTAPADAARYPYKYRCRVCLVERSLMTKGPIEILHHYRTDAHLVKDHRIRMETQGLPLFDQNCDEITGMALKYAKERARREYTIAPKLGDYYLRVGQLDSTDKTPADVPDKEILSQMNLLRFGLVHGGHPDTLIALWHDLVRETKTIEPIVQHDRRPFRVFVSQTFSSPIFCDVSS